MQVVKIKGVGFLGKDLQTQMMTQIQIEMKEVLDKLLIYGHKEALKHQFILPLTRFSW